MYRNFVVNTYAKALERVVYLMYTMIGINEFRSYEFRPRVYGRWY